jgi:hypothetical protein
MILPPTANLELLPHRSVHHEAEAAVGCTLEAPAERNRDGIHLGFGRIVASGKEAPINLIVDL